MEWYRWWFTPKNLKIGLLNSLGTGIGVLALSASYKALQVDWDSRPFLYIFIGFGLAFVMRAKQLLSLPGRVTEILEKGGYPEAATHFTKVTATRRVKSISLRLLPFWLGFVCTMLFFGIIYWRPVIGNGWLN